MSSTREIRERIDSIRGTMKITNAMYMISSTKLNNARRALKNTEPFFFSLEAMFMRLLRHLPEGFSHPYLDRRETNDPDGLRRAILCVTADKGLAGAYNHNVIRMVSEYMRPDANDMLFVVGEVGRQYFERHHVNVDGTFHYTAQKPTQARARAISARMLSLFEKREIDEVYIIYTQMKNAMETETKVLQLLPLVRLDSRMFDVNKLTGGVRETFFLEPNPSELLNNIVPAFLNGYIYSALVESYCAEHSCRMQAMEAANRNGQQLVAELTIRYNRERQARITQEITEVAAGARARAEQQQRAAKAAQGKE